MNIFDLAVKDDAFDVVISSGVLHHTRDARRAFAAIVRKAKPGGIVVVGLYNRIARVPTMIRSKLIGLLGPEIDYVVRNRIRDRRKAEIWIKDQYYNPHETWHSIDEVFGWFRENGVSYLGSWPRIVGSTYTGQQRDMFTVTNPGSKAARILSQISWLNGLSSEGALFMMIGRRGAGNAKQVR
jgi:SAM-dependent methyltransferase